jgi:hypothetical protein
MLSFTNIISACTGFTASDDNKVLVGINEDSYSTRRYVEIYPPEEGKFGKILFGYEGYGEQNGMNDQGLFWDGFACPYLKVNKGEGLTPIPDPEYLFNVVITENCSTIYDVIELLDSHDIRDLPIERCQVLFVDRFGNSVIFEGDDYIFKEGDYQAVTNFYQTHPELGGFGFDRYATAINMLENMNILSMEYFKNICSATSQSITIYSLVCNLTTNIIQYYYAGDFQDVWEFNLNEEFELGQHSYDVLDVFNNNNPIRPNRPIGPVSGSVNSTYNYSCIAIDIDGDQLYYKWDFGDGNISKWIGPYNSGEKCTIPHTWKQSGNYSVRVKVRDNNCGKSEWSNPLSINMPKYKSFQFPLINWFMQRFDLLFPLLKYIFRGVLL